jgi:beta-mannanase
MRTGLLLLLLALTGGTALGPVDRRSAAAAPAGHTLYAPLALARRDPSSVGEGAIGLGSYQPAFPDDLSGALSREGASGRKLAIIHWFALWGGWKSELLRRDLEVVRQHGSIPLITWEPWAGKPADAAWSLRKAILSGEHDAYIESWARGLAEYGQPVLLRFAHEMHDQTYPWATGVNGNTADEYVAAWRHVRAIFARYQTSNVRWVWSPNIVGDAPASAYESTYRRLYPGDAEVDFVALDVYNTGTQLDWGAPVWRSFDEILTPAYGAITAVSSRRVIVAELGCAEEGGDKAAWIAAALSQDLPRRFPRLSALVWFDVAKEAP